MTHCDGDILQAVWGCQMALRCAVRCVFWGLVAWPGAMAQVFADVYKEIFKISESIGSIGSIGSGREEMLRGLVFVAGGAWKNMEKLATAESKERHI